MSLFESLSHSPNLLEHLNLTEEVYEFMDFENSGESTPHTPCMDSFYSIGHSYRIVHGYISLLVCFFGTFANIFNLLILTRKEMRTPINLMLTGLAFADVLVMLEYIPFALHMYIFSTEQTYSYNWAVFVLFHSHFTQILHTISIQLTLTMAIWRYVAIKVSTRSSTICSFARCYLVIGASFICPIIICIPNYLTFSIYHQHKYHFKDPFGSFFKRKEAESKSTLQVICEFIYKDDPEDCLDAIYEKDKYYVDFSNLAKANNGLLHGIHFWTFSVFVKLIPCLVLTFFMGFLVNTLYKAKKHHKALQHQSALAMTTSTPIAPKAQNSSLSNGAPSTSKSASNPLPNGKNNEKDEKKSSTSPLNLCPNSSLKKPVGLLVPENTSAIELSPEIERKSSSPLVPIKTERKMTKSFLPNLSGFRKGSHCSGSIKHKGSKRSDRTSKMLIAVLFLFLITEFPQGIMAFLSGVYGQEFFRKCYNAFAEVWDILALINSAINFILYCFMSKQFRLQFRLFFKINHCFTNGKWINIQTQAQPSMAPTTVV